MIRVTKQQPFVGLLRYTGQRCRDIGLQMWADLWQWNFIADFIRQCKVKDDEVVCRYSFVRHFTRVKGMWRIDMNPKCSVNVKFSSSRSLLHTFTKLLSHSVINFGWFTSLSPVILLYHYNFVRTWKSLLTLTKSVEIQHLCEPSCYFEQLYCRACIIVAYAY